MRARRIGAVAAGIGLASALMWSTAVIPAFAADEAPVITTTTLDHARYGAAYTGTIAATSDSPVEFTVTDGALPAGLGLSSAGALSGTPTTLDDGSFTVTATNAFGTDVQAFDLVVDEGELNPGSFEIVGTPRVGTLLTATTTAWSPAGTDVAFSWFVGSATSPTALGTTYTPVAADAGQTISLHAVGSHENYASLALSITSDPVLGAVDAPTLSGTAAVGSTLGVTTSALPTGATVAVEWRSGLDASGPTVATTATFVPQPAHYGLPVWATVTITFADSSTDVTVLQSSPVTLGTLKSFVHKGSVSVSGSVFPGGVLKATTAGTWSSKNSAGKPVDVTPVKAIQWLVDGVYAGVGSTFTVPVDAAGKTVSTRLIAWDSKYKYGSVVSGGTRTVMPAAFQTTGAALSSTSIYPRVSGQADLGYPQSLRITVTPTYLGGAAAPVTGTVSIKSGSKTLKTYTVSTSAFSPTWTTSWNGRFGSTYAAGKYSIVFSLKTVDGMTHSVTKSVAASSKKLVKKTTTVSFTGDKSLYGYYAYDYSQNGYCYIDSKAHLVACRGYDAYDDPDYSLVLLWKSSVPSAVRSAEKWDTAKVSVSIASVTKQGSVDKDHGSYSLEKGTNYIYPGAGLFKNSLIAFTKVTLTYTYHVLQ